jgi:hypothetical protein
MQLLLVHGMGRTSLWVVAVEEAKLVPGDRPIILPVGHAFMMNDRKVQLAIRQALRDGAA